MVKRYCAATYSDNLENPPEYAVPTLSQERKTTILYLQTIQPSLFIHTTSPAKRLENSTVRFEREIQFKRRLENKWRFTAAHSL